MRVPPSLQWKGCAYHMDRTVLYQQFQAIRAQTEDPNAWIETAIGSDLWVDGLNVFLTVDENSFQESMDLFFQTYSLPADSKVRCVENLAQYCQVAAKVGEYELYQALALGMTWLSMQQEALGQFFNVPIQVTNHSTAILLSRTYRTLWLRAYNEGLSLVVDLESNQNTIFRPEHGSIYQKNTWLQKGERIRYPFGHFFHEMTHILLFADLYSRVLSENPAEEISMLAHLEACINSFEEQICEELNSVCSDLNLIDDHFGTIAGFPQAGAFRVAVHKGAVENVTPKDIAHYLIRHFQLGEGSLNIPDNPFKEQILRNFASTDEVDATIHEHYETLLQNQHYHGEWGKEATERNRLPAFREVIELTEIDPFYMQKLAQSLEPALCKTPDVLLADDMQDIPEPCEQTRRNNMHKWALKERLHRIAEIRGYLQLQDAALYEPVLKALYDEAIKISLALANAAWEMSTEQMDEELLNILSAIACETTREKTSQMIRHRFTYLLLPA